MLLTARIQSFSDREDVPAGRYPASFDKIVPRVALKALYYYGEGRWTLGYWVMGYGLWAAVGYDW